MRARWLVLALVLVFVTAAGGTATAVFASRRHLTVNDLMHLRHHHGPGVYPDAVRDNYASACRATSGGDTSLCGCVYNKMAERYTLKEFESLERVLPLGLPDEVEQMVADCGGGVRAIGFESAKVIDCVAAVTRPTEITFACGDGGVVARQLTWTSWGGSTATGAGVIAQNDCQPDCAEGTFHEYRMQVRLTGVRTGGSGPVYTAALVEYDTAGPNGDRQSTFELPTEPGP